MRLSAVTRNLAIVATTFLLYGVLAGVFVPEASFFPASALNYATFAAVAGLPIQVFRAACAVMAAWGIIRMLDVFRWETQEALRISEFRYATIASAIPVFVFIVDRNMVVTFIQGRGLEMIGVRPDRVQGRHVSDIFAASDGFAENCRRALSGQQSVSVDFLGGVPFEICYSALKDEAGNTTNVVGVALDVSAELKAQQELNERRQEMEKHAREAAVGALSAMMGREVAEPLSVGQLLLERVLAETAESDLPQSAEASIRKGLAEVSKAREVLARFLSIAHADSTVSEQPVGLYQIARRTVSVFAESARRKGLVIAVRDMDIVPFLTISPREMEQIFYHLIQQAVEAAGGDGTQRLVVSCSASPSQIELAFCDTCSRARREGSERRMDRVLGDIEGEAIFGLGLGIVKQIVLEHGGEVTVDTELQGHTIVKVRLPAKRVC